MSIAKHYETGEPLPEEVYQRLVAAKTFRAGSLSLRQVGILLLYFIFMILLSYIQDVCLSFSDLFQPK